MIVSELTFNLLISTPKIEEINSVEKTSIALKNILIKAERSNIVILNRLA